ncbi:hypothetical protein [Nocardia alni]|uniref:hypothetical protein n=1 Tax=Nocardia alni TaxID=2815723 RepID=UPI001C219876|nr:hypothetical protein [Nocardia alni]
MRKRLIALAIAASAVLIFAFGMGFTTHAAMSTGVLIFCVGIISCALLGAGLGTIPHAVAAKSRHKHQHPRDDVSAAHSDT